MIFSSIHAGDDLSRYPEAIARAIRYASTTDFSQMEDGRYPIDGDRMFVQLFHLTSKQLEETKPELHEKYVDVQYWLTGEELYAAVKDGTIKGYYQVQLDQMVANEKATADIQVEDYVMFDVMLEAAASLYD